MATAADLATLQASLSAALDRITALEATVATQNYAEPLDTIWMLNCGYLVWFMSAGFCFLEMGSVRVKHSQNILAKNMIVPVIGFLCWYVSGYALAFGPKDKPQKFIGATYFVLYGFSQDLTNMASYRKWFFQGAFCDTSASIVSGGIAERMTMFGYCVHTIFMTSFIYPIVVFWAWSGYGWLNFVDPNDPTGLNYISTVGPWYKDWAGSGVIHWVGGVAALCGAIVVGPRKGRFDPGTDEEEFTPHSVPFTVLGTFILWLGWFGFNPGCTLTMHDNLSAYKAAIAAVNSTLAPAAGGIVAWFMRRYVFPPRIWDVPAMCNGVLAGLVAVTAPSGFCKHWEALIIGAIAGVLYCCSCFVLPKLKIDDPIDAVSVHFVNGAWGAIAIGFFASPHEGLGGNGVFYGGNQLGVQIVALIVFGLWSAVLSLLIFVPLRIAGLLRWSDEIQDVGANLMEHSPTKNVK